MSKKFEIIKISENAPEDNEYMGTKEKFWFHDSQLGLCLCFPNNYLSPIAIEFAQKILEINQNKLLEFRKNL